MKNIYRNRWKRFVRRTDISDVGESRYFFKRYQFPHFILWLLMQLMGVFSQASDRSSMRVALPTKRKGCRMGKDNQM